MEAVCAPFSFEAAHGVMPVMVMCCGATARRHVSKVAVVDVLCAFRMLLCVGTVCCPATTDGRHATSENARLTVIRKRLSGDARW